MNMYRTFNIKIFQYYEYFLTKSKSELKYAGTSLTRWYLPRDFTSYVNLTVHVLYI